VAAVFGICGIVRAFLGNRSPHAQAAWAATRRNPVATGPQSQAQWNKIT
jgi:hypothetical protein